MIATTRANVCHAENCGNRARYFELQTTYQRGEPYWLLRWCGIHDMLCNGGEGKRVIDLE